MNSKEATDSMLKRLDVRANRVLAQITKLKRLIEADQVGGEEDRLWLDQIAATGGGLDICCGDFLIHGAEGVDTDVGKLGASYSLVRGEALTSQDSNALDFVVCNYFDAFPNVLQVLNEWRRVLKPGGTIGFICCNSDSYFSPLGPLKNRKRLNCFTEKSIVFYLERAEYTEISIEDVNGFLRVRAKKPA